jgi:hypothetical protein
MVEHLVNTVTAANKRDKVARFKSVLIHMVFDCLYRVGKVEWIVLTNGYTAALAYVLTGCYTATPAYVLSRYYAEAHYVLSRYVSLLCESVIAERDWHITKCHKQPFDFAKLLYFNLACKS